MFIVCHCLSTVCSVVHRKEVHCLSRLSEVTAHCLCGCSLSVHCLKTTVFKLFALCPPCIHCLSIVRLIFCSPVSSHRTSVQCVIGWPLENCLLIVCSLSVHCLSTVCPPCVHCLSTVCTLYAQCEVTVCLLSVYCLSNVCSLWQLVMINRTMLSD